MLETLEQLESDIADFHSHVAESNKTYRQIQVLLDEVRNRTEVLDKSAVALKETIDKAPTDLAAKNAESLSAITAEARSEIEGVRGELAASRRIFEQEKEALLASLYEMRRENAATASELLGQFGSLSSDLMEQARILERLASDLATRNAAELSKVAGELNQNLTEIRAALHRIAVENQQIVSGECTSRPRAMEDARLSELTALPQSVGRLIDQGLHRVSMSLVLSSLSALGLFVLAMLK